MQWRAVLPAALLAGGVVPRSVQAVPEQPPDAGPLTLLFWPFWVLASTMVDILIDVFAAQPVISPNTPVAEIHQLALAVTFLLAGVVVIAGGLDYIVGMDLRVGYQELRVMLPQLIIALGFSLVSLEVLQLAMVGTDALVTAFRPTDLIQLRQFAGLSTALVLVWVLNSVLLLAVTLLFVFRHVYLLFIAAVSPLVALAWAYPKTRPYAATFISGWWALLIIAPVDVLALRFSLELFKFSDPLRPITDWLLGTASFILLLWLPHQLFGVSHALVGRSRSPPPAIRDTLEERWPFGSDDDSDRDGTDWVSDGRARDWDDDDWRR